MRGQTLQRTFDDAASLGAYAATRALERLKRGLAARGHMTLGCPGGRSARTTYMALAKLIAGTEFDGSKLHLTMMDEYVEHAGNVWRAVSPDAHFSCTRFGDTEIRGLLNAGLSRPIPRENLHLPDANAPHRYEEVITKLGGIDLFLLASGASDGHVAFNPAGTPLEASTRLIELAAATRADNLQTFPDFRDLSEVPKFGVSVGPATIARHSRSALLILTGAAKGTALRRISSAQSYDPTWPATIIHACADAEILVDQAAVSAMEKIAG